MTDDLQLAAVTLKERFGARLSVFAGQSTLTLNPGQLVPAARALRDEFQFDMLIDLTAVDYWPELDPRFHVVYQLYSFKHNARISLRVPVSGVDPNVDTLSEVWPASNWFEREIFDMFGIRINGHPDLRRILMPADWQGHPLRKDYPTGYEEVQFTFNVEEIDLRKPYAKE